MLLKAYLGYIRLVVGGVLGTILYRLFKKLVAQARNTDTAGEYDKLYHSSF